MCCQKLRRLENIYKVQEVKIVFRGSAVGSIITFLSDAVLCAARRRKIVYKSAASPHLCKYNKSGWGLIVASFISSCAANEENRQQC